MITFIPFTLLPLYTKVIALNHHCYTVTSKLFPLNHYSQSTLRILLDCTRSRLSCLGIPQMALPSIHLTARRPLGQCYILKRGKCHICRVKKEGEFELWHARLLYERFYSKIPFKTGAIPIHIAHRHALLATTTWAGLSRYAIAERGWIWRTTSFENHCGCRGDRHQKRCHTLLVVGEIAVSGVSVELFKKKKNCIFWKSVCE